MPHPNLAVKLLEKLLKGEVSTKQRENFAQSGPLAEILSSPALDRAGPGPEYGSRTNLNSRDHDFVQFGGARNDEE